MLTYIFCLLFTLNGTFSYGLENTVDETLQRTNQQAFFANQDSCLQKAAKEHSVVYEVRQQLLHKGIQRLQPSKLDIQIGGGELSESEMVNMFNKEKKKFINEMANDFDENVANTLILINLRAKQKLPDGSFSDPQNISYQESIPNPTYGNNPFLHVVFFQQIFTCLMHHCVVLILPLLFQVR